MTRILEYLYLVVAMGVAAYLAANFKSLPLTNKIFLALVVVLCAFMFSFRRKQRQVLEEMDAKRSQQPQEDAPQSTDDTPSPHDNAP